MNDILRKDIAELIKAIRLRTQTLNFEFYLNDDPLTHVGDAEYVEVDDPIKWLMDQEQQYWDSIGKAEYSLPHS